MSSCVEVIIIGCGTPKFSMGWTHLFQMLQPPLSQMAKVVGVVEPFFLAEAGRDAKGADLFRAYVAEHPEIPFVPDISDLPPVADTTHKHWIDLWIWSSRWAA